MNSIWIIESCGGRERGRGMLRQQEESAGEGEIWSIVVEDYDIGEWSLGTTPSICFSLSE